MKNSEDQNKKEFQQSTELFEVKIVTNEKTSILPSGKSSIFDVLSLEQKITARLLKLIYNIDISAGSALSNAALNYLVGKKETSAFGALDELEDVNDTNRAGDVVKAQNAIDNIRRGYKTVAIAAALTTLLGGTFAIGTAITFIVKSAGNNQTNNSSNTPTPVPNGSSSASPSITPSPSASPTPQAWPEGVLGLTFEVVNGGSFNVTSYYMNAAECIDSPQNTTGIACKIALPSGTTQYYRIETDGEILMDADVYDAFNHYEGHIEAQSNGKEFFIANPLEVNANITDLVPNEPQILTVAHQSSSVGSGKMVTGLLGAGITTLFAGGAKEVASNAPRHFQTLSSVVMGEFPTLALTAGIVGAGAAGLGLLYWLYTKADSIDQSNEHKLEAGATFSK